MCLNDPLAHVRKPFQKLLERVAVRLDMESRLTHINITAEKLGRSSDDDDVGVRQSDEDRSHIGVRVIRKSRIDVSQKKSKMRKLCASSDCANRLSRGIFSSHPGMLTHSVLSGYGPSVPFARKFPHHSGRIRWLFARRRLTCTATRAWPVTVTRAFLAVEVTAARIEPTAVLRRVLASKLPFTRAKQIVLDTFERAYLARDPAYDGLFIVGVRTTGIFCRPTCPVRSPRPENVEFFPSAATAVFAGYRACKRCRPLAVVNQPDWAAALVERIDAAPAARVTEKDLRALGVDPATVRRHFVRHYGMTFQAYTRARRLAVGVQSLQTGATVDA
ncbi:MAG: methylphosphotriester-DNA--protein-cysteine methyltransferase family protein, partial [Sphingomonadales bacterium]|nr:methylphosphotriester-DNA--protein-cysteine methyltransferase family protein [Sphingomonadales bacterium]